MCWSHGAGSLFRRMIAVVESIFREAGPFRALSEPARRGSDAAFPAPVAGGMRHGRDRNRRRRSGQQAHQLIDGQYQNAEHRMAIDLGVAAHADMAATAVVLEPGVDALDVRALVVTLVRRVDMA